MKKFIFVFLSVCNLCFTATAGSKSQVENKILADKEAPAKSSRRNGDEDTPDAKKEKRGEARAAAVVQRREEPLFSEAEEESATSTVESLDDDSHPLESESSRSPSPEVIASQKEEKGKDVMMTSFVSGGVRAEANFVPRSQVGVSMHRRTTSDAAKINLDSARFAGMPPMFFPDERAQIPTVFRYNKPTIHTETIQQFIVEYSKPSFMNEAGWDQEKVEIDSFYSLDGVLQPYLNHVACKIKRIVQEHKRTFNAFICYKWPGDQGERGELQRKIKLMRTFFRGSGLAATMDVVNNKSGKISVYRETLKETDMIIFLVTKESIESAREWKKEKEEQAQVSGTGSSSEQKNNLWKELDTIQKRLGLEGKMPGEKQQLIYPLLMEPIEKVSEKLQDIWPEDFIYHDIHGEKLIEVLPEFVIQAWSNYFEPHSKFCEAIKGIMSRLEQEKERYNNRLEGVKEALEAIKGGAISGASADDDAADGSKEAVEVAAILKDVSIVEKLPKNLKLCLESYCMQQKIKKLGNLYTRVAANHELPTQTSSKPSPSNAYDLYFAQKSLQSDVEVYQKGFSGLGIYHFVMAQKFHAIQPTEELLSSEEAETSVLKFHDGYASGNIAFKAYEWALKCFDHCRDNMNGADFFRALCHEGRGHLLISNRVGDPWEMGENYEKATVQLAKEEFECSLKIHGSLSKSAYQLAQIAGISGNDGEILKYTAQWQRSSKEYQPLLRKVKEAAAGEDPQLVTCKEDLSTAAEQFSDVHEKVMSFLAGTVERAGEHGQRAREILARQQSFVCEDDSVFLPN